MTPGVVTLGVVTLGVVALGAGTPGVVTLGVVTLGTVTPGGVTPGVVTLGAVTPGTVTALPPAAPGAVPRLAGPCAAAGEWEVAPTDSAPPVAGRCTETEAERVAAVPPAAAGRAPAR